MMFLRFAIAAGVLALLSPQAGFAQDQWVYAADTSASVVYGMPLLSGGQVGPMTPVSGHGQIMARELAHLSGGRVAFVTHMGNRLVVAELESGDFQDLGELPFDPASMEASPDGNRFSILTQLTSGLLEIHVFDPDGAGWERTTHAVPGLSPSDTPVHGDRGSDGFYILAKTSGSGEATLYSYVPPGGTNSLLTSARTRLISTERGTYVALSGVNALIENAPVEYSPTEEDLGFPLAPFGGLAGKQILAMQLRENMPTLAFILTSGLMQAGGDSIGELEEVFAPYMPEEGRLQQQPTMPETLLYDGKDGWLFHEKADGALKRINTRTGKLETWAHFSRGSGPGFSEVQSIISGTDGLLYVLDDEGWHRRIMTVDPQTGNRAVLQRIEGIYIRPEINVTQEGEVTLLRQTLIQVDSKPAKRLTHVTRLSDGTLVEGAAYETAVPILEVEAEAGGNFLVLQRNAFGPMATRIGPNGVTSGPAAVTVQVSEVVSLPVPAGFGSGTDYAWEVPLPQAIDWKVRTLGLEYPTVNQWRHNGFILESATDPATFIDVSASSHDQSHMLDRATIFVDLGPLDTSGLTIYNPESATASGTSPLALDLTLSPSNGPVALVQGTATPGELMFVEQAPLRLSRWSDDLQTVTGFTETQATPEQATALRLARSWHAHPENPNTIIAAGAQGFTFHAIDATTGAVTALHEDAPAVLQRQSSGMDGSPQFMLAVGPGISQESAAPQWRIY